MRVLNKRYLNKQLNRGFSIKLTLKRLLILLAFVGLLSLYLSERQIVRDVSSQNELVREALVRMNEEKERYRVELENIKKLQTSKNPTKNEIVLAIKTIFGNKADEAIKIFTCESSLIPNALNINTNGSVDGGLAQINSVHVKRFGLSYLGNPIENIKVAYELFKEQGWRPWESSRRCWGK